MDYKFFIDTKMKTSKYLVYKCDSLSIKMALTMEQIHANTIDHYNICIEKHKNSNIMQLRLSNVNDNTNVFICTIDDGRFEQFKVEQSLYVTFDQFVNHITEMMEKCRHKQMSIMVTMVNGANHELAGCVGSQSYQLQFYEKGAFKNLIHISLPIIPAPYEVILFHINQTYAQINEENRILMQKNMNFQMDSMQKSDQIERLNGIIAGLKTALGEQEKALKDKYKHQLAQMEADQSEMSNDKLHQAQEYEKQIAAQKNRIDTMRKENFTLGEQLKAETRQNELLRIDNKKSLNSIGELNQQLNLMKGERAANLNVLQRHDQIVTDLRKQVQSLEQQLTEQQKRNQEMMAEVQAEKNISQKKKDALKMLTEDVYNANTIIRRQAVEIEKLKRKVELRTEVALKQEQVIRESGKGKENMGDVMKKIDVNLKQHAEQNQETELRLQILRDKTNLIENKYRDRIDEIFAKLHAISPSPSPTNDRNNVMRWIKTKTKNKQNIFFVFSLLRFSQKCIIKYLLEAECCKFHSWKSLQRFGFSHNYSVFGCSVCYDVVHCLFRNILYRNGIHFEFSKSKCIRAVYVFMCVCVTVVRTKANYSKWTCHNICYTFIITPNAKLFV